MDDEYYKTMMGYYEQIEKYNKSTKHYLDITSICLGLVCVIQVIRLLLLLTGAA